VNWIKKHRSKVVKKKYLLLPDEMKKILEIKNVFISIDKDGSSTIYLPFILFDSFYWPTFPFFFKI